jgi:transposase
MSKSVVSDALWAIVAPLLPPERPKPKGGRPRISDRRALTGILFVLKSGIPWEMLPQEMGCGSGMTCWRRLRDWQQAGVWQRLHHLLLQRLQEDGRLDWERAALDSASVPAPAGGEATGKDPTNRGKLGTKRHLVVDCRGLPLAVTISASNLHDAQMLEAAMMRSRPCACRASVAAGHVSDPRSCMPTRARTSSGAVRRLVDEQSSRVLLGVALNRASG